MATAYLGPYERAAVEKRIREIDCELNLVDRWDGLRSERLQQWERLLDELAGLRDKISDAGS